MMSSKGLEKTLKYRWLVWGVMVVSYALVFFHSFSMGVVKDHLIKDFALTESTFVSIGNVYFVLYLLMQAPTGILVDTLGSRWTATLGTLIAAFGILIFSFSNTIALLYIGRSLVGLGTAVIFVSIIKIQSAWFRENEFGTITGWTCFIGVMGGAIAQTPLALMVEALGWRWSFRLIGIVSVVIAGLIYLIARNRPSELGLQEIHDHVLNEKPSVKEIFIGLFKVFINPRTWPLFFMYAAFYGSYVVITGYYGTSFVVEAYGFTLIDASSYFIAVIIGAALGSIFVGTLSDKMASRKKPLIMVGALYMATWGSMYLFTKTLPPAWTLWPLLFLLGFASCAYVISWPAVKEVNDPKYVGVAVAVANIGGFFGTIVIPPIVARVISNNAGILAYQKSFFWVFVITIIGFGASLFTKETGCRNIFEMKGNRHESKSRSKAM
ncbi:MFS transporter [Acidaminobacter sp. JC074]|uniref:MFS transporter n=1 Tax=Acidaminobacter sp. JC074 TaxID=2530199 RepID=UPI001F11557B|nr:MFS transporter [Acidaminobacter sp. JC074]MCH4886433.1 MFS transporter [Acidaminobacter sp. JC074]